VLCAAAPGTGWLITARALQAAMLRIEDDSSVLAAAIGTNVKGSSSPS